jgi:hypothetical protein
MPTVFIDTCVFLHYKPFQQLPWRKIAGAEKVFLVVSLPVVNELDSKTHDPRLSERATRSQKDILANIGKEIQDGVTLVFHNLSPHREDFPSSMNPDHQDDLVIFCAQRYSKDDPDARPVLIASADFGMRLRSPAFGIEVLPIPDDEKLPDVQDEVLKKLRKAEAELAAERNRRPKLILQVTPNNGKYEEADSSIILPSGLHQVRDIKTLLVKLVEQYPMIGSIQADKSSRPELNPMLYDSRAIEWYNEDVDRFLRHSERFFTMMNQWVESHGSFFAFDLFIDNQGNAPATQVRLEITFPSFVKLLPDTAITGFPNPPRLPRRGNLGVAASKAFAFDNPMTPIHRQITTAIERANSPTFEILHDEGQIRSAIPTLPHKNPTRLRTFVFWFPKGDTPKNFGATYIVRAAVLPQDDNGTLTFKIQTPA